MAFKKYSVSPLNFVENKEEVARFEELEREAELSNKVEEELNEKEGE